MSLVLSTVDHSTLYLKCAVEESSESTVETLSYQENPIRLPCISSLIKKQELLRVGKTRTDQLTFSHQVAQLISKFGTLILNGGKHSNTKERTLLTQEVE